MYMFMHKMHVYPMLTVGDFVIYRDGIICVFTVVFILKRKVP